jgi:hypothetical protein
MEYNRPIGRLFLKVREGVMIWSIIFQGKSLYSLKCKRLIYIICDFKQVLLFYIKKF